MSNRRLGQQSFASILWFGLALAACSSGQTGDAGLGAGAVGTNQNDDGDDTQSPPDETPANTHDAGDDDNQSTTDNPPDPGVPNPSGDCAPEDNGGREGYHSPDASDSYLPDCTLTLQREYYRVFQKEDGKAYIIPRPDGHSAWLTPCSDETHPLHALVLKYQLCKSAETPAEVEAVNAIEPADALTLTHALHEELVFYPVQDAVAPWPFSPDIVAACKSNEALRTGVFEARCDTEIELEGKPRPEEVVTYSPQEAAALAAALNTLYGIEDDVCERLTASARETLQATIDQSRTCTTNDECVSVGRASDCHDSCEDVINVSAQATIDTLRTQIDDAQCVAFDDAGCVLIHPPCDPGGMAQCVEGQCVEGF